VSNSPRRRNRPAPRDRIAPSVRLPLRSCEGASPENRAPPVGSAGREALRSAVQRLTPKGKTPLTDAVIHAAEALRYTEREATVVLISDGIETCNRDPCEAAEMLERTGVDFTAHVIGFDIERAADQAQLRCLAEGTGGRFQTAGSAQGLQKALDTVKEKTVSEEEEPPAPDVTVKGPDKVTVGTRFEARWRPTVTKRDHVTIVPADAPDDHVGVSRRVSDGNPATLRAPAEPGTYEIRYVLSDAYRPVPRALRFVHGGGPA
jgi:Ca-activated chloride channel family protein